MLNVMSAYRSVGNLSWLVQNLELFTWTPNRCISIVSAHYPPGHEGMRITSVIKSHDGERSREGKMSVLSHAVNDTFMTALCASARSVADRKYSEWLRSPLRNKENTRISAHTHTHTHTHTHIKLEKHISLESMVHFRSWTFPPAPC